MTTTRESKDPVFDPQTLDAVVGIIERTHSALRDACLLQADSDEKAKHIEWYRGGAQCLLGLKGELEFEARRRIEAATETPEEIIDRNLGLLSRTAANWQLAPTPDPDDEL